MRSAFLPNSVRRLVNELTKLPSIGEKSAFRLVQHLLSRKPEEMLALEEALKLVREQVGLCKECFAISEAEYCLVCSDQKRRADILCVVEKPVDVIALEQVGGYNGKYHVLHGLWSPMRGLSPEKIKLKDLFSRLEFSHHGKQDSQEVAVKNGGGQNGNGGNGQKINELVLATSSTVEGDATAFYIADNIAHLPIAVTRLAQGLPKGGELEYADEVTLRYAFEGRKSI